MYNNIESNFVEWGDIVRKKYGVVRRRWKMPSIKGITPYKLLGIVLVAVVLLVLLFAQGDIPQQNSNIDPYLPSTQGNSEGTPEKVLKMEECRTLSKSYFKKCIWIGDSLTLQLMEAEEKISYGLVLADDRVNPQTILSQSYFDKDTARNALNDADKADTVYVWLGANGVSWMSCEDMIQNVQELLLSIQDLQGSADIVVLGLPNYTNDCMLNNPNCQNSKISKYNQALKTLCEQVGACFVEIDKLHMELNDQRNPQLTKESISTAVEYLLNHKIAE